MENLKKTAKKKTTNDLIMFSLVSFNLTSIFILQPLQVQEAFITTQFEDELGSFQGEAVWPENYERMVPSPEFPYNTFHCKLSRSQDKSFVRYRTRIIFSNRSYSDSVWQHSLWKIDSFTTYYDNFVIMLGLNFALFLLIITLFIIFMKIEHV